MGLRGRRSGGGVAERSERGPRGARVGGEYPPSESAAALGVRRARSGFRREDPSAVGIPLPLLPLAIHATGAKPDFSYPLRPAW